jgi:hypothetical protein
MKLRLLSIVLFLLPGAVLMSQKLYKADASDVMMEPLKGHLKMGDPGPSGRQINVNSLYLTLGGKPMLPVMGEMHYTRIRKDNWEESILKMKACGIKIISTYLFWNQHEEIEGTFDWEGEKDLRSFVRLCQEHGMYVIVRLGPWAHGEARNGGTPDWILRKKYITDRSNDVVYQNYVKRYFAQIAQQLKGLYYKDGGNIIGVQFENEYWHAREGEAHILWLKTTARELGIDVPLYTVTGWGNASVPPLEVIPLWGAYPDAPWDQTLGKLIMPYNFQFDSFRDNKKIGSDRPPKEGEYMSYDKYPYLTCEVGIGNQNTYHRRLSIGPVDGLGLITAKLGSGSNLLGYYMFTGSTQSKGLLHSTEEEQEETGYWTRVPLKSYDFQASIRESGEISQAYREVKKLHYMVNEVGEKLAPMMPVLIPTAKNDLQLALRSDNNSGFLFCINYCRNLVEETRKQCRFQIKFKNETIIFPQNGIDIPDSTIFIWPLNYDLDGLKLKYSTAQMLGRSGDCFIFYQNRNVPAEMAFDPASVDKITTTSGSASTRNNMTILSGFRPGMECIINAKLKDGRNINIILLKESEADNFWILDGRDKKECYISDADIYSDHGNIFCLSGSPEVTLFKLNTSAYSQFSKEVYKTTAKTEGIKLEEHPLLRDASWLLSSDFDTISPDKERFHRFFFKEFSLEDPSRFRKAVLYIYPETDCQLNLNNTFVRQTIKPGELNVIDLTGYVSKGENLLFVDFPFKKGRLKFAARIEVEYYNYDRFEAWTDQSWLFKDMYTNPVAFRKEENLSAPKTVSAGVPDTRVTAPGFKEWDLNIPYGTFENSNNTYVDIKYSGDRAELYDGSMLVADNFNDNSTWTLGLNRLEHNPEGKTLRLKIYDLLPGAGIYFDIPPLKDSFKANVYKFSVRPEYKFDISR